MYTEKAQLTSELKLEYNKQEIRIARRLTKNPVTLAFELTKNKTTDKEKFDAIFAWVGSHIHYNYYAYFSSNGYGKPDIKQILKHRFAICLGYANLMDTLCKLSGIDNVTIWGYAKDDLFDVNDSIYIDNHAWNAVKLNGRWFVYDVTWSSGKPYVDLTKWSAFKYKYFIRAFNKRKLQKAICEKIIKTECDTVPKIRRDTILVEKRTYWNKVWLRFLSKTKYRFGKTIRHKLSTDYYLCDPDTFVITHFPDDPAWALTNKHKIREFECDSAFYHLTDSTYKHQNRHGRYCGDCDSYLTYDNLNMNIHLRNESAKSNPRNLFIAMLCNYNICYLKFDESKKFEDSLSKVSLLDTAIFYNDLEKEQLRKSFTNIEIESELQRTKNRKKEEMLLNENYVHRDFINKHKNLIRTQNSSIHNIERLFINNYRRMKQQKNRILRLDRHQEITRNVKNPDGKIAELTNKLRATDSTIAVLDSIINNLRMQFTATQKQLNANVDFKILQNDSVFGPFYKSMRLRQYGFDNYKKPIVLVRKDINRNKENYVKDLDEKIYKKVELWEKLTEQLLDLTEKRDKLGGFAFDVASELVRRGKMSKDSLPARVNQMLDVNKQNSCWVKSISYDFSLTFGGFKRFLRKQEDAYFVIERENRIEGQRYVYTDREIQRRKRKYRNIVISNSRVVSKQGHIVKKEKREFLKMLRKQRREEAKLARKNK